MIIEICAQPLMFTVADARRLVVERTSKKRDEEEKN